ncbi:hypothetical protein C8R45DRAFT_932006 [Mycena sanguinolenta]|nr:hypothetical protein C8R45DRAFT_932006 [Mycena sanguinolenta]
MLGGIVWSTGDARDLGKKNQAAELPKSLVARYRQILMIDVITDTGDPGDIYCRRTPRTNSPFHILAVGVESRIPATPAQLSAVYYIIPRCFSSPYGDHAPKPGCYAVNCLCREVNVNLNPWNSSAAPRWAYILGVTEHARAQVASAFVPAGPAHEHATFAFRTWFPTCPSLMPSFLLPGARDKLTAVLLFDSDLAEAVKERSGFDIFSLDSESSGERALIHGQNIPVLCPERRPHSATRHPKGNWESQPLLSAVLEEFVTTSLYKLYLFATHFLLVAELITPQGSLDPVFEVRLTPPSM